MNLSQMMGGSFFASKRTLAGMLAVVLPLSMAACNRNKDDAMDVGRGPGDEAAHGRNTDPSVAQPGEPTVEPRTNDLSNQNTQGAPGTGRMDEDREGRTNSAERQFEQGARRDESALAGGGATGGSGSGGRSSTGGRTGTSNGNQTGGSSSRSTGMQGNPDAR